MSNPGRNAINSKRCELLRLAGPKPLHPVLSLKEQRRLWKKMRREGKR